MKNTYISIAFLLFSTLLSRSLAAQELEGEWQIKTSTIIGLLDTTVLFSRNSPDNVIDLSAITYQFNADGSYEGTDIWGNPMSGTWVLNQPGNTVSIDDKLSAYEEINDNEMVIYFPFQPFSKSAFTGSTVGSYLVFVRSSPNSSSSSEKIIDATLAVSPNPTADIVVAEFSTPLPMDHLELGVFNALGKQVVRKRVKSYPAGRHKLPLDLSDQPSGMYVVILTSGSKALSAKVLKR